MALAYNQPGLTLALGATETELVRQLQADLRRLGYLSSGIDGDFGPQTNRAVRSLQHDLLRNDGRGSDGNAPAAMMDFNRGRVGAVDGVVNSALAGCLEDILNDARVPHLPRSDDPAGANQRALDAIRAMHLDVPLPFLLAILNQESGLMHFRIPSPADADDFIVVGLDRNDPDNPDRITSRGYGVGQYTLFHHPPLQSEVQSLMLDPLKNVGRAVKELRDKFDNFLVGPQDVADDRQAETPASVPLRTCRYLTDPAKNQTDCRNCALSAPPVTIDATTPLYPGSAERLTPTQYHPEDHYDGVPDRTAFGCDWPYAARRYNGGSVNSYHYQAQTLLRLANDRTIARLLGG